MNRFITIFISIILVLIVARFMSYFEVDRYASGLFYYYYK